MLRVALAVLPFLASGCESAIPRVDPSSPAFSGRSPGELASLDRGRDEYIRKCSGCHGLYRPSRGGRDYWSEWMEAMAERSRLKPEERRRMTAYLFLVCRPEARCNPEGR